MKKKVNTVCAVLCGLLPVWGLLVLLARRSADGVERWYSQGFYPVWARAFIAVTSPLPFSLAEVLVIAASLLAVWWLVSFLRALWKGKRSRRGIVGDYLLWAGGACWVVLTFFLLGGGFNYYRHTFTQMSGLATVASPLEQLEGLCRELGAEANALRRGLPEDEAGVTLLTQTHREMAATAAANYQRLMEAEPGWDFFRLSTCCRPKAVFFSEAMSYMEIVGVFTPYTLEANVNVHTTDFDIPFAACHELAHISGFMREDEANFLAYAACRVSEDRFFRYSGALTAYIHATNALYAKDPERYRAVAETLEEGVRRDLAASSAYYRAHHTSFGEFSTKVNDTYLKVNSQPQGVATYGRMVDLLLADYRERHGITES